MERKPRMAIEKTQQVTALPAGVQFHVGADLVLQVRELA